MRGLMRIMVFKHTSSTLIYHEDETGKRCPSRIESLAYNWKGSFEYNYTNVRWCLDCGAFGIKDNENTVLDADTPKSQSLKRVYERDGFLLQTVYTYGAEYIKS